MTNNNQRPGRPLGLTLAILLSAFLYAFVPLSILGMQLYIQARVNASVTSSFDYGGETFEAFASGGDAPIVTVDRLIIDGGAALFFLIICIIVWRGGRSWMRTLFTGTVLLFAGITIFVTLRGLFQQADIEQGISSADVLVKAALSGQLTAGVIIPLYVLWYVNRAPARAFFRGSFNEDFSPEV